MRELLKSIEALLQKEGFTDISIDSSAHSYTLSAQRGEMRAVMYMTDQEELPHAAAPNKSVPKPTDIRMTATFPGISATQLARAFPQVGGIGGGSASMAQRPTPSTEKRGRK